ncbi:hypothetical protein Tco_1028469 [Tanacetum coccineum]|uniref:Uncharacterized protein n=1 Tax=Tanacetum coccineum TaxID=301880 RepID=A0ABQ5G1X8_9ASTR
MQKAKKNMRKINFKKADAQKFKEFDQQLEALTSINVSEVIDKVVHAKVLTKMKKLLPTHVSHAVVNYVKPKLNNPVHEVMRYNQISLFTKPSTNTNDLSELDLKLKLLNIIYLNKSKRLILLIGSFVILYEFICINQDALNAQDAEPSFHKRTYNDHDPPNNREREKKKKRRKDVGEPFSRSSRKEKSLMVQAQEDTHVYQSQYEEDAYVQQRPNAGWFTKKLGSANAKRKHELIQKDELIIADLEGAGLEKLKKHYKNDVELEYHADQLKEVVLMEA